MKRDLDFLKKTVIAHRGIFDNLKVPENSVKSFIDAINKNYGIEFDIHLTKDNKIVVFHDDKLSRMTNKNGFIKDYTFEELKKTKLLNTKYYIPSLEEVLDLVDGKVPILIEIKYDYKKKLLCKELIKVLDNYKGEFAIQSFDPSIVSYFRFHKNSYLRGLLLYDKKDDKFKRICNTILSIPICKPDFLSINKSMIDYKNIKRFNKKKDVFVWTIKSKKELEKYYDMCDNVICNIKEIV